MSPEQSNPKEEKTVLADHMNELRQIEMEGYELGVRKARNALFWAGGLIFAGEMFSMYQLGYGFDPTIFGIALFMAAVFVGLGLWTRKKPYTALVTGLIAFILFVILSGVVGYIEWGAEGFFTNMVRGIFIKIVILAALVKGLRDARALQTARDEKF
jgi:asparagine N-glycosylation enzyme membrane subunit Stt3